jgi:hypothetical protein
MNYFEEYAKIANLCQFSVFMQSAVSLELGRDSPSKSREGSTCGITLCIFPCLAFGVNVNMYFPSL